VGFFSRLQRWQKHTTTATEEAAKLSKTMTGTVRDESCLAWVFFFRPLLTRPLYPLNQGARFCADGIMEALAVFVLRLAN